VNSPQIVCPPGIRVKGADALWRLALLTVCRAK